MDDCPRRSVVKFDLDQLRRDGPRERIVRAVAGTVLAHPWFDGAAFFALRHWFFPLSRLWAAAREADGDVGRFFEAVPMAPRLDLRDEVRGTLAAFERARAAAHAIEKDWDLHFFGSADVGYGKREAVEAARLSLRHAYNGTRRKFRFLVNRNVPRVKSAIAPPEDVAAIYGAAARNGVSCLTAFPDPMPVVEVSHRIATPTGEDYWLRFKSPSPRLGDVVYARVHEPRGLRNPPTIIFGHGICVEFDHWRGLVDECHTLVRAGFRVIRPEAPWHGRRNGPAGFGGESIIASFPMGVLDALTGALIEWATLARWSRETSAGPLAFAGSSLGALTAQFAADRAKEWPEELRPDALLLLTHTGDLSEVVLNGALANLWIRISDVEAKGWTEDLARSYLRLLQPSEQLSVPAERIVSVLGGRDTVLPFAGGRRLVETWGLPAQNVFVWDRGHFSVPMTLVRNQDPVRRFAAIFSTVGDRG